MATNDIYRGKTFSLDDPVLTLAVSADTRSGVYGGAAVSLAAGDRKPRLSNAAQYIGYAQRLGRVSVEGGVLHRTNRDEYDPEYDEDFSEVYIGVTYKSMSARVYVSPDYVKGGSLTYYGSMDARLASIESWTLTGHVGYFHKPEAFTDNPAYHGEWDGMLTMGRPIGRFQFAMGIAATTDAAPEPLATPLVFAKLSRAF